MTRRSRILLYSGSALLILLLTVTVAGILVLRSPWFHNQVRNRIVQEVERVTGGTVKMGAFHFDWRSMTVSVDNFQLRGTEPETEKPFVLVPKSKVGLRIVSIMKHDVDLLFARVEHPQVNILVDKEGHTNIPSPKIHSTQHRPPLEYLLRTKIERLEVVDGLFHYGSRKIPLNLTADGLKVDLQYDPSGPRYEGMVQSRQLRFDAPGVHKFDGSVNAAITLERNRILTSKLLVDFGNSSADLTGWIEDLEHPRIELTGKTSVTAHDMIRLFALPVLHGGSATAQGTFRYDPVNSYSYRGNVTASNVSAGQSKWQITAGHLRAVAHVAPDLLELHNIKLSSTQGDFNGTMTLRNWHDFDVAGKVDRVPIQEWARILDQPGIVWQGQFSGAAKARGRIDLQGITGLLASSQLVITPEEGPQPVQGTVDFDLDQRRSLLSFHNSTVVLPNTRLTVDGSLGERISVDLESRDLHDLAPAIQLAGGDPDKLLPVTLKGGVANFRGTVTGDPSSLRVDGRLAVTRVEMENHLLDQVAADVTADKSAISIRNLTARQGETELLGNARAAFSNWKLENNDAISANFSVRNAKIGPLLKEGGISAPIDGLANLTATVKGTLAVPAAEVRLDVVRPALWGEHLDSLSAALQITRTSVGVPSATLALGTAKIRVGGSYDHPADNWKSGTVHFTLSSPSIALASLERVKEKITGLKGSVNVQAEGSGKIEKGEFLLTGLSGTLASKNMTLQDKPLGDIRLDAKSNGQQLDLHAAAVLSNSKVTGEARVELTGNYQAKGEIIAEPLAIATIQNLVSTAPTALTRVIGGSLDGRATFSGPLRDPGKMSGEATISRVEIKPNNVKETLGQPAAALDLTLRNSGPVKLAYLGGNVKVEAAHFVAKDTNLFVEGSFSSSAKQPWDLKLKGDLNLAILQNFNSEVKVSGTSVMDATMRGAMAQPALTGRLEVKNASLYIQDLPNGIDNANGTLIFDNNRVVVRQMQAQSGGGDITLRGFASFASKEMVYRLQAQLKNVRVRYPEGISNTFDANLNFSGTLEKSLLSGTATVMRSGITVKTDLGGLFAAAYAPVQTGLSSSPFLLGLQLDITVVTAPDFQLFSSYAKNVQAESRLHVLGTAAKPSVLGRIVVSEGEIDFFGTRYTVTRAEVNFYNPSAIEPVLDADLETKVRAVTVTIKLSGPPSRLRISYRSDPPLSSTDIISLLTVGRSPEAIQNTALPSSVSESGAAGGGGALLGQLLSTSVSGALQKFFGVSRVKIDPRAIGVDGTPQAQLTVEQQISRDVTLTYSTGLQNAQQQIVRVEWNLGKQWSIVAVRDQFGLFGIDFFYKRRLK